LPGWLNTDVDGTADYYLDVTAEWPIERGSLTHIFADNVIEHLTIREARAFLRGAISALEPSGTIRLVTPDARTNAEAYISGDSRLDAILDRHRRHGYEAPYAVDVLRVIFSESGHHAGYLFDEDCLSAELSAAGFAAVRRQSPGQSGDPLLVNLEARTEAADALIFMVLEADAPGAT
jgi:predicted SAM-dependent methyltransferase